MTLLLVAAVAAGPTFLRGGDVSEIPQVEASGAVFRESGRRADPFDILQRAGWNFVRFRVWNHPADGWCDKAHTLALARRAKAHGMAISLDFHYSDTWADPGKQTKPAAWKDLSGDALADAVRDYTQDVVGAMIRQGTPPAMVQIGNEIVGGMLWPDGKLNGDDPAAWKRLAALIRAGIEGVHRAAGPRRIATLLHLDRGADNRTCIWWFDHLAREKVAFDAIGLSYYPWWHGPVGAVRDNLNDLAGRYGKDLYLVETAYMWKVDRRPGPRVYNGAKAEPGYPATSQGQSDFVREMTRIVKTVPDGRGKGILYWAPTWIAPKGEVGDYTNLALFDEEGNALPAVRTLGGVFEPSLGR